MYLLFTPKSSEPHAPSTSKMACHRLRPEEISMLFSSKTACHPVLSVKNERPQSQDDLNKDLRPRIP